jgi:hypothetical protein
MFDHSLLAGRVCFCVRLKFAVVLASRNNDRRFQSQAVLTHVVCIALSFLTVSCQPGIKHIGID